MGIDTQDIRKRIALALGTEPIEDARYLLPVIALPDLSIGSSAPRSKAESLPDAEQFELRMRFSRSIELRLMPPGRRFPARDVWRAAYALGIEWGDLNLFHWHNPNPDPAQRKRLFTLSAAGDPAYFLPERAAEGEAVAGLVFSFELPSNPAPMATYDRMAVALDYFRQRLGGHPTARDGAELDHDRLFDDREALRAEVETMTASGIAPGSAEARRFF